MNNDQTQPSESYDSTSHPETLEAEELQESSSVGLKIALVGFVLLAGIAAGYGWLQHDAARQLASERAELQASLTQAKSTEDSLTARVNALSAAQAQEEAARAQAEALKNEQMTQPAQVAPRHATHSAPARRAPAEDPRWNQMQQELGNQQKQLAENQKQIAETQANLLQTKSDMEGNLQSAKTELGGDIARNHAELLALQKKGERNYYEFSFEKSKNYHHTGPLSISLRKADSKHEYCDLQMLVDDREISRKHVNLYESISFYPDGYPLPVEVVINHIDKDSIRGYVSEPKYRTTEQAAAPTPATATAAVNAPAPTATEVKLDHRDDGVH